MPVHYDEDGPIVTLTIDGYNDLNPMDPETFIGLGQRLGELDEQPGVKVAILRGAGEQNFSAGGDLRWVGDLVTSASLDTILADTMESYWFPHEGRYSTPGTGIDLNRKMATIYRRPTQTPVIAAIKGYCVAGGFIACLLHSSIRIAGTSARFGFPETKRGLAGGVGISHPRGKLLEVGAMRLMTGDWIDAAEALRIGLVNEVVSDDRVFARAREVAEKVATMPRVTVLAEKRALFHGRGYSTRQAAAVGRMVATMQAYSSTTFAPDGPLGPPITLKGGDHASQA